MSIVIPRLLRFSISITASLALAGGTPIAASTTAGRSSSPAPINTLEVVSLRQFSKFSDTHSAAAILSPDGTRVAFLLREPNVRANSFRQAWYVASAVGPSDAIRVGDGGEIALSQFDDGFRSGEIASPVPARWSPDGRKIAFIAKHDGAWEAWIGQADGRGSERLLSLASDVRDIRWKEDGSSIFLQSNKRTRRAIALSNRIQSQRGWRIDESFYPLQMPHNITPLEQDTEWTEINLATKKSNSVSASAVSGIDSSSDLLSSVLSKLRGGEAYERIRQQYTVRPDVAAPAIYRSDNKQTIAFPLIGDPPDRAALPTATVAIVSSTNPTRIEKCADIRCVGSIQGIWLTRDAQRVIFQKINVNLEGDGVYEWDLKTDRVDELLPPRAQLERCSIAGADLICLFSSATRSPVLVRLDTKARRLIELFNPNPEFKADRLPEVERLDWANSRGDRTFGYLVKPAGFVEGRRYPLVIATYRAAGFFPDVTGGEYPIFQLAQRGIMVLVFNRPFSIKLARSSEEEFEDDFADRRNVADSLETVVALLEGRNLIDPRKIALTGLSDGTTLSMFEIMHGKLSVATAILSSNTYEPADYYLASLAQQRAAGIPLTPAGPEPKIYDVLAPSRNVAKFKMPILFNLADSEALVVAQTLSTFAAFGSPYDAYMYPGEYHLKWQPAHLYWINERNIQWLEFWLLGKEAADPVEPTQYDRWREMRAKLAEPGMQNVESK